jgi:hypothetical protein
MSDGDGGNMWRLRLGFSFSRDRMICVAYFLCLLSPKKINSSSRAYGLTPLVVIQANGLCHKTQA